MERAVRQVSTDAPAGTALHEHAVGRPDSLAWQLRAELNSRLAIEQAKGVVAERRGVTLDQAYELLRAYAHSHGRQLPEVADALMRRDLAVDDLPR